MAARSPLEIPLSLHFECRPAGPTELGGLLRYTPLCYVPPQLGRSRGLIHTLPASFSGELFAGLVVLESIAALASSPPPFLPPLPFLRILRACHVADVRKVSLTLTFHKDVIIGSRTFEQDRLHA